MSTQKPLLVSVTISTPGPGGAPQCAEFTFGAAGRVEAADASPYSFSFTGQHDGGSLVSPREGPYRELAATLADEAKVEVDAVLKRLLSEQAAASSGPASCSAATAAARGPLE